MSNEQPKPAVGQLWRDMDKRSSGREGVIRAITETHATVQWGANRFTKIRLDRFKAGSTGYMYIREFTDEPAKAPQEMDEIDSLINQLFWDRDSMGGIAARISFKFNIEAIIIWATTARTADQLKALRDELPQVHIINHRPYLLNEDVEAIFARHITAIDEELKAQQKGGHNNV